MLNKVRRTIGLLRQFQKILPRPPLITIYKSFIRSHLVIEILSMIEPITFLLKIESNQYNTTLAITGAIRGTFREKLYYELRFEPLASRGWYHKLFCFYNVFQTQSPRSPI